MYRYVAQYHDLEGSTQVDPSRILRPGAIPDVLLGDALCVKEQLRLAQLAVEVREEGELLRQRQLCLGR